MMGVNDLCRGVGGDLPNSAFGMDVGAGGLARRPVRIRWLAGWILLLCLLAGSAGAEPTFSPDPSYVELAPGQTLTVSITPAVYEVVTDVYWELGSGSATVTESGGTAVLTVPESAEHCSAIQDKIIAAYDYCPPEFDFECVQMEPTSATVFVWVVDPLQLFPTTASIAGAPGSTQTLPLQVSGGVAPYEVITSSGAAVSLSGGVLSYTIPADATGTFTDTVTVNGTASEDCGAHGAHLLITVTVSTPAVALSIESGAGQVASSGQTLQPFVVKATANGEPLSGVAILWTLMSGQGDLSSARILTDTLGQASSTLTPASDGEFVVRAQVEGTTQSVTFTALFNPLASLPGLTGPQRSMATTLDILCPKLAGTADQRTLTAGEQDLLTQCQTLISSSVTDPSAAAQGVAALTPEQASAPRKLATQITGAQLDNITTRLSALRRGARGISLRNLTVNADRQSIDGDTIAGMTKHPDESGGGASADDTYEFERLGIFVSGNIDWGSKDRSANEDGFDFNTQGITAGVDYRFLEGWVLGLAFGYGNTDADIDANGGDIGADALSSTLYGTYYATDHFYLEGSGTYGWGSYDQTRNISYSLLGGAREAKADYNGDQYAFMFGLGYDIIRGPGILDLYGRLRYVKVDLDSYREQGASGLDLDIDSQEATSLMSILGANYTGSISLAKVVLVPQGWLEWLHEYDDGDDEVNGSFVNDPNRIPFALATDSFDTDSFRVGLGMGAQFGQGRTAFVTYEARVGLDNYTEQTANLGVRLDF